ncbi:uncharacterized protein LOC131169387 [Hevea brasiliensis]|uniref:uncharacterized protein LOC131169387 n=1 Tax=Hevea brasiliensis TaxID=3981 RepID=UPI0025F677EF|nr:uncharacterized protein LOC131169387 [Hevea brasiliensis]
MKPGETISEMSIKFTDLLNVLKALEKEFIEEELVKKVLRSLPKSWETKVTVIFDTKDFSKFTYDELISSLIAHEMLYCMAGGDTSKESRKRKREVSGKLQVMKEATATTAQTPRRDSLEVPSSAPRF